jgi:thymidylate synthase ThyX
MAALLASWARSGEPLRPHGRMLAHRGVLSSPSMPAVDPGMARTMQLHRQEKLAAYGHDSIGEHAVVHLAAEGISLLAARAALDSRTVSFVEKAGQARAAQDIQLVEPHGLDSPGARSAWTEATRRLLEVRDAITAPLTAGTQRLHPRADDEPEGKWARRCDDIVRSIRRQLLPMATRTDIALTCNARGLRVLLDKLAARPEREVKLLGERLGREAATALPGLMPPLGAEIRYRAGTDRAISSWATELLGSGGQVGDLRNRAKLVRTPDDVEARLVTAILYRFTELPYAAVRTRVDELDQDARTAVLDEYLRRRGRHDDPLRDLEHVQYTFELVLDGVALHEVQRHRISTRTPQSGTASHGYLVDPELVEAGMDAPFRAAMDGARSAFRLLEELAPEAAPYVLPLGFRQRVLVTWNLRSLHHFVQQRSARTGNRTVRHIAQDVFREIERVHPIVARTLRVDLSGSDDVGGR